MLSRVAENLYWMTRYLERAENTARLINSTTQMLLDLPRGASFGWDALLKVAGLNEIYDRHYASHSEANIMRFLIHDADNPSSVVACNNSVPLTFRTDDNGSGRPAPLARWPFATSQPRAIASSCWTTLPSTGRRGSFARREEAGAHRR